MSTVTLEPIEIEELEAEEKLTPEQEAEWRWYYYINEIEAREVADNE